MRFSDNVELTAANMAGTDILAGTDVSADADKKFSLAGLGDWFVSRYNGQTLAGSSQSVKSAIDGLNSGTVHYANVQSPIITTLEKVYTGQHQDYNHQGFAFDGIYYYFARFKTGQPFYITKVRASTGEETSVQTAYTCHANNISIYNDLLYITGNDNDLIMVYDKDLNFVKTINTPESIYSFGVSTTNQNVAVMGISTTEFFAIGNITDGVLQIVGGVTGASIPATNKQGVHVGNYIYQLLSAYGGNHGSIRIITMFGLDYGEIIFDFDDTNVEYQDLSEINGVFYISDAKGNVYKTTDLSAKLSNLFTLSPFTPPNFGVTYTPITRAITPTNILCDATFYTNANGAFVLKTFKIPSQIINRNCIDVNVVGVLGATDRIIYGDIAVMDDKRLTLMGSYSAGSSLISVAARYIFSGNNLYTFDDSFFHVYVYNMSNGTFTSYDTAEAYMAAGANNKLTIRKMIINSVYYHNANNQTL